MNRDLALNGFLNPKQNTAFDGGFTERYFSEDPSFYAFSVFFDIDSPLLNPASNNEKESAERYFLNQDDDTRAAYVAELRDRLLDLANNYRHFMQTLSGLNGFYSKDMEEEIEINITTLESLDMRVAKIKELYTKVSYDYKYKRELLPDNLRWINMRINVHDGRKLAKWINGGFVDITPTIDTLSFVLEHTQMFVDEGHEFLEEVSNVEAEMATNNLAFTGGFGYMEEDRLAIGKFLNLEKEKINSVNHTVSDSKLELDGQRSSINKLVQRKESLVEQLERLGREKIELVREISGVKRYNEILQNTTLENLADQFAQGGVRLANQAANDLINNAANAAGATSVNSVGNQLQNGKTFFEILQGAVSNGTIDLAPNQDLERKILEGDKLSPSEKQDLFSKILSSGGIE